MTALLVVDLQNDFCPGGALPVGGGDEIVPLVNRLVAAYEHPLLTQDWHPPRHLSFASEHPGKAPYETAAMPYGEQVLWPDHCVQGTPGADFHPGLDTARAELIVRKGFRRDIDSYSAFRENDGETPTGLAGYLRERGITRLVLCGLAADFCVRWSAEDARRLGFEVAVVAEATRAIDTNGSAEAGWRAMREAGAHVLSAEEALAEA